MKIFACALCLVSLVAGAAHAGDRVQAGNWESTLTTDGDSHKIVFCLSAEQAAALNADSKAGRDYATKKAGGRCTVTAYEASGESVTYSLTCGDHVISDATRYHGDKSDGTKTTTVAGKATVTKVSSKRLGACP